MTYHITLSQLVTLRRTVLYSLAYFSLVLSSTRTMCACLVSLLASLCLHLVRVFNLLLLLTAKVDAMHYGVLYLVICCHFSFND